MELLHRYSRLKQRMIGERFGGLDEGLVSGDRKAIREKIETEPKIRKVSGSHRQTKYLRRLPTSGIHDR
jgi:hypothetical protein